MHLTEDSRFMPTAHQLYRKIVNKISFTQQAKRNQFKKQFSNKFQKHMSLLQSHRKRQIRFESNFTSIEKNTQQKTKQIRMMFKQKDKKIRQLRNNFLQQKKKKMQNSLNQWQGVVIQNKRKHQNLIQQSSQYIKQWNQKCQQSICKKRQRLNTISSNLNQRSRISSAKTLKYQQEEHQKLLQRALVNHQKSRSIIHNSRINNSKINNSRINNSRSKIFNHTSDSRISVNSRVSTQSRSKIVQKKRFNEYLQRLVKKQNHIKQVRNKKNELINNIKKQRQNKSFQIDQLHKQNNYYLSNKRQQMQAKLDSKYLQNNKHKKEKEKYKQKQTNKSLPAINTKSTINNIYGHKDKDYIYNSNNLNKYNNKNKHNTLEPRFQKIIMDQLRNISLVSKMKQFKH